MYASPMPEELDKINRICRDIAQKDARNLLLRLEIEHKILIGKIPMPKFPPLRVPFIYRESK